MSVLVGTEVAAVGTEMVHAAGGITELRCMHARCLGLAEIEPAMTHRKLGAGTESPVLRLLALVLYMEGVASLSHCCAYFGWRSLTECGVCVLCARSGSA